MTFKTCSTAVALSLLAGCAATPSTPAPTAPMLTSDLQKSSYAQGVGYMQNLQKSEIPLDQDLFVLGLNDALGKKPLRLDAAEIQKGQDWVFVQSLLYNEKLSASNLAKGQAFLNANKDKPGVVTTASGLQYKIIEPGQSSHKPTLQDSAHVHYRITRLDGQELTNTYKNPDAQPVIINQLVKGWQEAMLMMPEGAKWQLFVPTELAYGEAGAPQGGLGPNELLIYEVTLVSIDAPGQTRKDNGIRILTPEDMKKTSSWKKP